MGNINNLKIAVIIVMFCLVSTNVFAFAISAPYSKDNPLSMQPGETKDISFVMQNLEGDSDVNAVVSLLEGKEIAEIISGTTYSIPLGTVERNIVLRISIPSDASAGNNYNVKFSVQSSPVDKEGDIQLGVGYNVDFPVIVLEKTAPAPSPQEIEQPEKSGMIWIIVLIVAIVIVIGLIIWLVKRKKAHYA